MSQEVEISNKVKNKGKNPIVGYGSPGKEIPTRKAKYDKESDRKHANEMVTGIFKIYDHKRHTLPFVYRDFKENKLERYFMENNVIYTVRRGVAEHLNSSGTITIPKEKTNERGEIIGQEVDRVKKRYEFIYNEMFN